MRGKTNPWNTGAPVESQLLLFTRTLKGRRTLFGLGFYLGGGSKWSATVFFGAFSFFSLFLPPTFLLSLSSHLL